MILINPEPSNPNQIRENRVMSHAIDAAIRTVAEAFAVELQKIREHRTSYNNHQEDIICLRVSVGQKGGMSIEHSHGYGTEVRAADFGTLLDEVYRRAGFDEREAGRLQVASANLLPLDQVVDKAVDVAREPKAD